ncbi:hypothetical protein OHB26_09545 [Nocardia sp. NBC_01503]|uniref:hypothetical protein n=1 Tax=Nocardia sp. NBC_01503 TaxID=2975997 RepID=UPI002E7B6E62|nr:hypothetical protein [Nocardia sp. NBC_01503]WTL34419.1 hypothetical protein OHB26_09545 [Nocardia sp. NBC_01503]
MRSDFAEHVRLTDELAHAMNQRATQPEIDDISRRRTQIDTGWYTGPHATDWRHLNLAFETWQFAPEQARRHLSWAQYYRDEVGQDQLTPVQWRNIEQAQELSSNTFEVDYERNAPDAYRWSPDTPTPTFGTDRPHRSIQRER